MSSASIERYSANESGRDFVVGDIHGEFVRLNEELAYIGFNPARDRLFSVGDLVDRGPDSIVALEWLKKPWFHAVLGNHEELVLTAPRRDSTLRHWVVNNGGGWWLDTPEEQQNEMIKAILKLPLAIEIASPAGAIGIVHADVPRNTSWTELLIKLEAGDKETRQYVLWSRNRVKRFLGGYRKPVPGVRHVFCGHSPMSEPKTFGNVIMVDTGACYGGPMRVFPLLDPLATNPS